MNIFPTIINSVEKMYRYQNIVPSPISTTTMNGRVSKLCCVKPRKYTPRHSSTISTSDTSHICNESYNVDQSQSVQRRNARERNRVKQVNNSFTRLRQHIPQSIIIDLTKGGGRGPHKKISKVDTLRIAVEYIRRLQELVEDLNKSSTINGGNRNNDFNSGSHPANTTSIYYCDNNSNSKANENSSNTSAIQQQQQLTRQQYPNHPLTPISLNTYPSSRSSLQLDTQSQLLQTQMEHRANCHSPSSSFNSSISFDSGTYEAPQQLSPLQYSPLPQIVPNGNSNVPEQDEHAVANDHLEAHLQLKFEPCENFNLNEEDCTPDDEEILDYISLWQEQ